MHKLCESSAVLICLRRRGQRVVFWIFGERILERGVFLDLYVLINGVSHILGAINVGLFFGVKIGT